MSDKDKDRKDDPEWDDMPQWQRRMIDAFERQLGRAGLTFEVPREEMAAHLNERAAYYEAEVKVHDPELATPEIREAIKRQAALAIAHGQRAFNEQAAIREANKIILARLRDRSRYFRFMASHLPKVTVAFLIGTHEAQALEMIPNETEKLIGAGVPIGGAGYTAMYGG